MAEVSGRPIFAALHMLLCAERLFSLPEKQRLPAILADSRKYQNVVSTQLAEQVLAALFELLRGFQAADAQPKGELLRDVLAADPNEVYAGLLTVLMRLVFILYAEDRGSCPATRCTPASTRSPGYSSACGPMLAAIPTRWTSAMGPGRNCWPYSA